MSEIETTKNGLERRSVIKGAAWSVPVIAAAVATPLASASPTGQAGLDLNGGCVQILGVQVLPGFEVENTGTAAYTGTVTVVETIDLSSVSSQLTRAGLWVTLGIEGSLPTRTPGVEVGAWTGSGGNSWLYIPLSRTPYTKATRTVTYTGTIAPNANIAWGKLISLGSVISNLLDAKWTAQIVAPTGNPPVVDAGPRQLDWSLLGGC